MSATGPQQRRDRLTSLSTITTVFEINLCELRLALLKLQTYCPEIVHESDSFGHRYHSADQFLPYISGVDEISACTVSKQQLNGGKCVAMATVCNILVMT